MSRSLQYHFLAIFVIMTNSLAAQQTSTSSDAVVTQATRMPVDTFDTSMVRGRRDFTVYREPGMCLAAAQGADRIARRAEYDTARYNPEHASPSDAMVTTARQCGAHFTVNNVSLSDLLDLMHLDLILGRDMQAEIAANRYVASFSDSVQRRWALYAIDTTYLYSLPIRWGAVDTTTAKIDALGQVTAVQRYDIHSQLETVALREGDTQRVQQEIVKALTAYAQANPQDLSESSYSGNAVGLLVDLLLVELSHSPKTAIDRTVALIKPTGFPHIDQFLQGLKAYQIDWAIQQIDTSVPPLKVAYWGGRDSSAHAWPVPGKVSILIKGINNKYGMWKRIAQKYGNAINVTILQSTQGYIGNGPPLLPAQEAAELMQLYCDKLDLPVTVAVGKSAVRRLPPPSNELVVGAAPYQNNPYYQFAFIMTDRAGKILLMLPGDAPPEAIMEAWLKRELGY